MPTLGENICLSELEYVIHYALSLYDCITVPLDKRANQIFFFSFEYFDPFDHYDACWVTLYIIHSLNLVHMFTKCTFRFQSLETYTFVGHLK